MSFGSVGICGKTVRPIVRPRLRFRRPGRFSAPPAPVSLSFEIRTLGVQIYKQFRCLQNFRSKTARNRRKSPPEPPFVRPGRRRTRALSRSDRRRSGAGISGLIRMRITGFAQCVMGTAGVGPTVVGAISRTSVRIAETLKSPFIQIIYKKIPAKSFIYEKNRYICNR